MKADRQIIWLVVLGIAVRLVLSAFLFHTDIKNIYLEAGFINSGWKQAYHDANAAGRPIYYPPLVYSLVEINRKLSPLFSDYFKTWLGDGTALSTSNHPHLFRDLFAMKLPWLIADLLIAWLLFAIVEEKDRRKVIWLWLFNPLTLYAVYGFANYDILPTLFVVASIFFVKKEKLNLAYLSLGLAAGLKLFGILLLPVLLLLDRRSIKEKMLGLALGLTTFMAATFSAWLDPFVFRSIFLSSLANTLFRTRLELFSGFYLPIFLSFYFVYLLWLMRRGASEIVSGYLPVIGLLLGFSYFNPQWIIWLSPLLVLVVARAKSNWPAYLFVIAGYFLAVVVINDKFVSWGLLKAVNNAFDSLNPLVLTITKFGLTEAVGGLGRAVFLAGATFLSFSHFIGKKGDEDWEIPGVKISGLALGLILLVIFGSVHVVLAKNGRYIALTRTRETPKIALTALTTIRQTVPTNEGNINAIEVRLKNVELRTEGTLIIKITNQDGSEVRDLSIDSGAIGDDYNLLVNFIPIRDTKGMIVVTLSMPEAQRGRELLVPYDEDFPDGGLVINNESIKGSLAFTIYFNPGGWKENIGYSLKRMATKW